MKPEADQILNTSALQLLTTIVPVLPSAYPQGTASLIAILSIMVSQEYERGAAIRVGENNEMRSLFEELAPATADVSLRQRLLTAARTEDTDLNISSLNAANHTLRQLLIELQAHIENRDGKAAREAERRIWHVLKASADRRMIHVPSS